MVNEQPLVIWHNPSTLTTTQVITPQFTWPWDVISNIGEIINSIMMIVVLMMIMPIMSSMMQGMSIRT